VTLDFQGYLRLTDDPCEETNNPGQWIRILTRETRLTLNPTWRPAEPELAQMDEVLVVREARDYDQTIPPLLFILPDDPTPLELTRRRAAPDRPSRWPLPPKSSLRKPEMPKSF